MAATATESKPRNLFTVKGGAGGIEAELSKTAKDGLSRGADILGCLALANGTFPKARAVMDELAKFIADPTAKAETKTDK